MFQAEAAIALIFVTFTQVNVREMGFELRNLGLSRHQSSFYNIAYLSGAAGSVTVGVDQVVAGGGVVIIVVHIIARTVRYRYTCRLLEFP